MYDFPNQSAELNDSALWRLQCFLIKKCENYFGVVANDKRVYQPVFNSTELTGDGDKPHIINTPNFDGAFASLSNAARTYWPTTLYELAHETVHLLNPVERYTNYLEEGMAVHFAVEMSEKYTEKRQEPSCPFYKKAWSLVQKLPIDVYSAGKLIREHFGSLGTASPDGLMELFPELDEEDANALCQKCNFI